MSKKLFTKQEIEILSENKYVKNITDKGITYTDEFKRTFISKNQEGSFPRQIFEECGFDIDILGADRVKSSAKRWRAAYKNGGATRLIDTRKSNSGRPSTKDLSLEEKYARLEAQNKLLKAENELLKKLKMIERRVLKKK
jgi:transposase